MTSFNGFSERALAFYAALEVDASREHWQANKAVYEREVRDPMLRLLAELEPEFGAGHLFRPYRDARRVPPGAPLYKTSQAALLGAMGRGYYLRLDADGLLVGGGFRAHSAAEVSAYRAAAAAERSGSALDVILRDLRSQGFDLVDDRVRRIPAGYPEDHPRAELLRYRSLMATRFLGAPGWLLTPAALSHIQEPLRVVRPLAEWCAAHLPPIAAAPRERG